MQDVAWIALSLLPHVGSKTLNALLSYFSYDAHAVLVAEAQALCQVPGVGPKIAQSIKAIDLAQVERAIARWLSAGVHILTPDNPLYPRRLRLLEDRPPVLFAAGVWQSAPEKTVAVVGTRSPSPRMAEMTQQLALTLSARGVCIVSGMARGIDTSAHLGALADPSGQTIAVLGSGLFKVYPPEKSAIAKAIQQRGALVCEVEPEAVVSPSSLVARNRIITGLSDALVVVETTLEGGAMYAARFAKTQGRPIYALDIPVNGNRALIKDGAAAISIHLEGLPF